MSARDDIRVALYAGADDLLDELIEMVQRASKRGVLLPTMVVTGFVEHRFAPCGDPDADEGVPYAMAVILATAVQRLAREQP